jgi:hypothetical protein
MNTRFLLILVGVVAAAGVLAWLLLGSGPEPEPDAMVAPVEIAESAPEPPAAEKSESQPTPLPADSIVLLFAGFDGLLHPEVRAVDLPDDLYGRARTVVEELLSGPQGKLLPVAPYAANLEGLYLDDKGRAFVDLTAPPDGIEGSQLELMLAYGVVNSVLLNCPELTAVQLLFGGSEVPTLTGHLDLSRPLVLNKRLIASS